MTFSAHRRSLFLPPQTDRLHELRFDDTVGTVRDFEAVRIDPKRSKAGKSADQQGRLAIVVADGKSILIVQEQEDGSITRRDISAPEEHVLQHCVTYNDYLIVAGRGPHIAPFIQACDLAAEELAWQPIPLPRWLDRPGKTIDDLTVAGDELIALDNVLIPKFLIRFDLSQIPNVKLNGTEHFCHGTWVHAHQCVVGDGWAAVLSSTAGEGGSGYHIAVWTLPDWTHVGSISQLRRRLLGHERTEREPDLGAPWSGIAAISTLLLIERQDGLGVIDIARMLSHWRLVSSSDPHIKRVNFSTHATLFMALRRDLRGPLICLPDSGRVILMADEPNILAVDQLRPHTAAKSGSSAATDQ